MSQSSSDKSILSPANWTDAGTTLALSLFLAVSAVLYVLADRGAQQSFGLFALSLLGFLGAILFLITSTRTRGVSELVVGIGCLIMLAFIAVFSSVVNGPNAFIVLLLLVPVCYAALNGNPLGTSVIIFLSAALWLLLNLSFWWPDFAALAALSVSTLPLFFVGVLVHLLSREVIYSQTTIDSLSDMDSLTGLLNRDAFTRLLDAELLKAQQRNTGFAILHIEIDDLHVINEQHGREQGDKVLTAITDAVARSVRQEDRVARFGGDTFAAFLAFASDKTTSDVTNRVRQNIYNMTLSFERRTERIKVSVGIAIYPESGATITEMLQFAEQAMQRDRSFRQHQKTNSDTREQAGLQQNKE
jgi:diguanylate cyclase (GGDEF)-like protein